MLTEVAQGSWAPPVWRTFPSQPSPLCLLRGPIVIFGALVDPEQEELSGCQGSLNLGHSKSLAWMDRWMPELLGCHTIPRLRTLAEFQAKAAFTVGFPPPEASPPQHTRLFQAYTCLHTTCNTYTRKGVHAEASPCCNFLPF